MDIVPASSPSKRLRSKKSSAAAKPKPPVRKSKASPTAPAEIPDLRPMIATAAYYLAAQRGFVPGYEMDDWLAAEQAVMARLG